MLKTIVDNNTTTNWDEMASNMYAQDLANENDLLDVDDDVLLVYIDVEEEPTSNDQFTLDVQESIDGVNDEMENENNDREVDAGLANIAVEPEKEKRTGQGLEQDQLMEDDVVGENMSPMEGKVQILGDGVVREIVRLLSPRVR